MATKEQLETVATAAQSFLNNYGYSGHENIPLIKALLAAGYDLKIKPYDPAFGDERICECGHTYYRHFDSYEHMSPVGCKYCPCMEFKEIQKRNLRRRQWVGAMRTRMRHCWIARTFRLKRGGEHPFFAALFVIGLLMLINAICRIIVGN